MVQAARSGVQNIAEGGRASGTSRKSELKLTNVARASLEELRLDYEDFLRQRCLPQWKKTDPRRQEFIDKRCNTALILITVAMSLLGRQLEAQAKLFEKEGGFTERLYQQRKKTRR